MPTPDAAKAAVTRWGEYVTETYVKDGMIWLCGGQLTYTPEQAEETAHNLMAAAALAKEQDSE